MLVSPRLLFLFKVGPDSSATCFVFDLLMCFDIISCQYLYVIFFLCQTNLHKKMNRGNRRGVRTVQGQGSPPLPPAILGSLLAHCRDATLPPAGYADLWWETLTLNVARTIFLGLLEPALGPGSLSVPPGHTPGGPVAAGLHPVDQLTGWQWVFAGRGLLPSHKA